MCVYYHSKCEHSDCKYQVYLTTSAPVSTRCVEITVIHENVSGCTCRSCRTSVPERQWNWNDLNLRYQRQPIYTTCKFIVIYTFLFGIKLVFFFFYKY